MRFYRGNLIVGTPWQKMLCISLCLVAFSPPAFSAPTTPLDEPTPAKKQAADKTSPAVESEAGPTFPNPVASDDSKSKVLSKAQPLESDESKGPSAQDESGFRMNQLRMNQLRMNRLRMNRLRMNQLRMNQLRMNLNQLISQSSNQSPNSKHRILMNMFL